MIDCAACSVELLAAKDSVRATVFYNGSIELWRSATVKVMCQFQVSIRSVDSFRAECSFIMRPAPRERDRER